MSDNHKGKPMHLKVYNGDGTTTTIGTWYLPGELINNYQQQESIGWHIMLSFLRGADKVVVELDEDGSR